MRRKLLSRNQTPNSNATLIGRIGLLPTRFLKGAKHDERKGLAGMTLAFGLMAVSTVIHAGEE